MSTALNNQTVVITGAGKGIGRATAIAFAKAGFNLALFSRTQQDLDALVKTIKTAVKIITFSGDITKASDITAFSDRCEKVFKSIQVLVNNAGIYANVPLLETSETQWKKIIDTNLKGTFLMTKQILPLMLKKKQGHIINIVSTLGKIGMMNNTAYCASKFGVVGFSKAVQEEFRKENIKVTTVYPGYVNTNIFSNLNEAVKNTLPTRNLMTQPETVAKILVDIAKQPMNTIINEVDFSSWM